MAGAFDDLVPTDGTSGGALPSEDNVQQFLTTAFPGTRITSGYRTPDHNAAIGGAAHSLHTRGEGEAVDFVPPAGVTGAQIQEAARAAGYPTTEWLHERAGDPHSTGDHIHWGFGPKTPSAPAALPGGNAFEDLIPNGSQGGALPAQGNVFADLIPKTPPAPAAPAMPNPLSALVQGIVAGGKDVGQTFGVGGGSADEANPAAQGYEWSDLLHPLNALSKTAYGFGKSAPMLAGTIAGGIAGSAIPVLGETGVGEFGGMAAGGAAGTALQVFGPNLAQELKATPKDPDGAYDRALKKTAQDAGISAASVAAFGLPVFRNSAVKKLMLQAFAIQPSVMAGGQALQNVAAGRPASEGIGQAAAGGVAGTLVPAIGHLAVKGGARAIARKPVTAPTAEAPQGTQPEAAPTQPQPETPAQPAPKPAGDVSHETPAPAFEPVFDPDTNAQVGWEAQDGSVLPIGAPGTPPVPETPLSAAENAQSLPSDAQGTRGAPAAPEEITPPPSQEPVAAQETPAPAPANAPEEITPDAAAQALETNIDPATGQRPKGNTALREMRARMQKIIDLEPPRPQEVRPAIENTSSFSPSDRVEKINTPPEFDPQAHVPAVLARIRDTKKPLTPAAVGNDLGISADQAARVLAATAAQKDSGVTVGSNGVLRRAPVLTGPLDAARLLAKNGGIRDDEGHDLRAGRGLQQMVPGAGPLIRPTGRSIDSAGELLWENGFFGPPDHTPRPTENDVLQLLERTAGRNKVYAPEGEAAVREAQGGARAEEQNAAAMADIAEHGKALNYDFTPDQQHEILGMMAENPQLDAENAVAEYAERDAMRLADEGAQETGENHYAEIPYDEPAENGRAVGEDGRASEAETANAGARPENGGPVEEGPRAPSEEAGAEGLPQTVIPGAEGSARQLAQARESAGRGRVTPRAEQREAGGMFAEKPEEEAKLPGFEEDENAFAPRKFGIPKAASQPIHSYNDPAILKEHPDYKAAKAGDPAAAARFVQQMVKPETVTQAKRRFGTDVTYVPVMAEEMTGRNQIPSMLADYYAAKTGATADTGIMQSNRAYHTGAGPMERMASRASFDGPVEAGRRYVLVDDTTVMGGSLADLANHIRSNGGEVAGVVTLANASRTGKFAPHPPHVRIAGERFGDEVRNKLGIEPGALTADEAHYLANFRDADALRTAIAKAGEARSERLRAKGVQEPEVTPQRAQEERGDIGRDEEGRMVSAYNAELPSVRDQYNQFAGEKRHYQVMTPKDAEDVFGSDKEDWPPDLRDVLEKHGHAVEIMTDENSIEHLSPDKAPTREEFERQSVEDEGGLLPADTLDHVMRGLETQTSGAEYAAAQAFRTMAEGRGWKVDRSTRGQGDRYLMATRKLTPEEVADLKRRGVTDEDGETPEDISVGVRISDHPNTSSVGHVIHGKASVNINIAPGAHDFHDAARLLKAAHYNDEGELSFSGQKPAAFYEENEPFSKREEPPFYSALTRAIEGFKQEKAPSAQWAGIIDNLRSKGVKAEEINWSGVKDWLATQAGPVTKDAVLQHLRENEVRVQEVQHGAPTEPPAIAAARERFQQLSDKSEKTPLSDAEATEMDKAREVLDDQPNPWLSSDTRGKYGEYTLPGGENYRELLLTKADDGSAKLDALEHAQDLANDRFRTASYKMQDAREAGTLDQHPEIITAFDEARDALNAARNARQEASSKYQPFKSSHFDEPNILAHVRFDDRTGPNGEKILHIAEVQSDWLQSHRRMREALTDDKLASAIDRMKKDGLLTEVCK
jgi:hypothetical protein